MICGNRSSQNLEILYDFCRMKTQTWRPYEIFLVAFCLTEITNGPTGERNTESGMNVEF